MNAFAQTPYRRTTQKHITHSHCTECGQRFPHTQEYQPTVCAACRSLESFEQVRRRLGEHVMC